MEKTKFVLFKILLRTANIKVFGFKYHKTKIKKIKINPKNFAMLKSNITIANLSDSYLFSSKGAITVPLPKTKTHLNAFPQETTTDREELNFQTNANNP